MTLEGLPGFRAARIEIAKKPGQNLLKSGRELLSAGVNFFFALLGLKRRKRVGLRGLALSELREDLVRFVEARSSGKVVRGPFKGMVLRTESAWAMDGDYVAKIEGFFEMELHPFFSQLDSSPPEVVVNLGCAEGYYAVGAGTRWPLAKIRAVDINPVALQETLELARLNAVENRLDLALDYRDFNTEEKAKQLWIVDIEGDERTVLDASVFPELLEATIIVELHPFAERGGLGPSDIAERFAGTHEIQVVSSSGRNPNISETLASVHDDLKWAAMSEGRRTRMEWAILSPRVS